MFENYTLFQTSQTYIVLFFVFHPRGTTLGNTTGAAAVLPRNVPSEAAQFGWRVEWRKMTVLNAMNRKFKQWKTTIAYQSGPFLPTSAEVTPNGGLVILVKDLLQIAQMAMEYHHF